MKMEYVRVMRVKSSVIYTCVSLLFFCKFSTFSGLTLIMDTHNKIVKVIGCLRIETLHKIIIMFRNVSIMDGLDPLLL